jgi:hypothetical protein
LKYRKTIIVRISSALILAIISSALGYAQQNPSVGETLYNTIARHDSLLFTAFNSRKLEEMKLYFDESLEVYQDNTGVRNFEQTSEAFAGLFSQDYVLTRNLVEGSLEVFPIKDFGAIETGSHTFCHMENGKPDCGTFRFVHIWKLTNNKWKITRIITYDH